MAAVGRKVVLVDGPLRNDIRQAAHEMNISQSELVRRAVRLYLDLEIALRDKRWADHVEGT